MDTRGERESEERVDTGGKERRESKERVDTRGEQRVERRGRDGGAWGAERSQGDRGGIR